MLLMETYTDGISPYALKGAPRHFARSKFENYKKEITKRPRHSHPHRHFQKEAAVQLYAVHSHTHKR